VIIFGSVRFLSKKVTKLVKKKEETEPVQTNWFRFGYFRTKTGFSGLARFFLFGSIFLVWLNFFRFGSVFFFGLGSIRFFQFQAYKTETKPNRLDFSKF
jgi:hypothetical protein